LTDCRRMQMRQPQDESAGGLATGADLPSRIGVFRAHRTCTGRA
jgi:hypothetical protein